MTLPELAALLRAPESLPALDALVAQQQGDLTLALLHGEVANSDGLRELEMCYHAFNQSGAGREWEQTRHYSPGIEMMLPLLALAFERSGATGRLKLFAAQLPESSVKHRLKALAIFHNNIHHPADYRRCFPQVLDHLSAARYETSEAASDNTAYVLPILRRFLEHGRQALQRFPDEQASFMAAFADPGHLIKWPVLTDFARWQADLAAAPITQVAVAAADGRTLLPSALAAAIFQRQIIAPITADPRTRGWEYPLGYDREAIRTHILEYGRADFRAPCAAVTPPASPADRVALYCFYNLRKHFFTTRYVLSQVLESVAAHLQPTGGRLVFLDLGCGPLTSGLALADLYQARHHRSVPMQYVGLDIAPAMLDKAREFSEESAWFADSEFAFLDDKNEVRKLLVERLAQPGVPVILNASYLFASASLDVADWAAFVSQLREQCPATTFYFIFQNPNRVDRNQKYEEWKARLPFARVVHTAVANVSYQTTARAQPTSEEVRYELLAFQS